MKNINGWQALAAFGISSGVVVTLILTGHATAITVAAVGIGSIVTAALNVLKKDGAS